MRPLPRVWTSASVNAAANEIRDSGLPAVGVTEGFFYIALVTQNSLAAALSRGVHSDDSIAQAYDTNAVSLPPYAPADRAIELFSNGSITAVPIVDDYGHLMGVLTPADLYPKRDKAPRPHMVGGMATPFGVYLTTGSIGAGAKGWALVATGVMMTLIFVVIGVASELLRRYGVRNGLILPEGIWGLVQFVLFLFAFRLLPLSGIHAAEHKVVHAIERGEELTRENVRRMPRVHPRCGTNLVVGLSILLGIGATDFGDAGLRLMIAAVATLTLWRPLGSLVQYWGTTKEPSDRQIDMGIRSGEELLTNYATGAGGRRSIFWRLWHSGIFHVLTGGMIVIGLLALIQLALNLNLVGLRLV